jgi:uncharacterized repeat protein (TIGR01451 family)
MRSNVTILKAAGLCTVLLLLLALSSTGPPASTVSSQPVLAQAIDMSDLAARAAEEGQIPVIVGLQPPAGFTPEGALGSPAAVDEQRDDIASARQALLDSLAGYNAEAYASWDSLPLVALKVDAEALQQLAASPYVTTIQEDVPVPPALLSTTALIGADDTWDAGFGGLGQTVVILDTGIDEDHPFFGGRLVTEACWSNGPGGQVSLCPGGGNTQTGLGSADAMTAQCLNGAVNLCAHGSHVAGIAAGRDFPGGQGFNGVAPEANIIAIQVFTRLNNDADCDGPGSAPCVKTYPSDQISALNYVNNTLRTSWDIASVNMSLGGGMNTSACDGDSRKASIDNLRSNGIATAIASDNDGWTDALGAPGCISTAVTVGAVTDADAVIYNMNQVVDLLAVGANVDSSVPDDTWGFGWGGTSMATPQVTGAFAVIKAINPTMSVDDIENLLKATGVLVTDTRPPNPAGANTGHVKPRLQLDAAVAQLLTGADLKVVKDCKPDDTAPAGVEFTCTIIVENLGPDPALAVTAVDQYVSSGTFQFGSITPDSTPPKPFCTTTPNPQNGAGTVTCQLGGMAPGDAITIRVPVTANETQDINDHVTVSSLTPDPDLNNNQAEDSVDVVAMADLEICKFDAPGQTGCTGEANPGAGPDPVIAGNYLEYQILVTNTGPSTASNVVMRDVLPPGVSLVSTIPSSGSCDGGVEVFGQILVTCDLGNFNSGETKIVIIVVRVDPGVPQGTLLFNGATVSSDTLDPDNDDNAASASTTVNTEADLTLVKGAFGTPIAGTDITYGYQVTNHGPSVSYDVSLVDNLPPEVEFINAFIDYSGGLGGVPLPCRLLVGVNRLTCPLGDIAPTGATPIAVWVNVHIKADTPEGSLVTNDADVLTSDTPDPNPADNEASATVEVLTRADLEILKTTDRDLYKPSTTVKYTIQVTNYGPSDAQNVVVVDTLPGGKKIGYWVFDTGYLYDPDGCELAGTTLTCEFGTLAAGASIQFDVYFHVVGNKGAVTNTVTVSSTTTDPISTNNTAARTNLVQGKNTGRR